MLKAAEVNTEQQPVLREPGRSLEGGKGLASRNKPEAQDLHGEVTEPRQGGTPEQQAKAKIVYEMAYSLQKSLFLY